MGLDCANGSSSAIAKSVFEALQAKTYVINNNPDGTNINTNCGSTHIEVLQNFVKENQLDFCISLGDFCEPVLENKRLVNAFLQTRVPMYYTIGNHETDRHHLDEILFFMI